MTNLALQFKLTDCPSTRLCTMYICGPYRCGKATLVVPITMLMILKGSVMG